MGGAHAGDPLPEDEERALAKKRGRRKSKHVRVTTEVPAGSDPAPVPEPDRGSAGENDARLRADKPPHY